MRLIRGLKQLESGLEKCVATIGNFDGVHLGHQSVIQQLQEQAKKLNLPTCVIIFEPQPIEYFAPDKAPSRLTRLREKLGRFRDLQIDYVVCLNFDASMATMSAEGFVKNVLVAGVNASLLIIGDDFRFGANRKGDYELLVNMSKDNAYDVKPTQSFLLNDERVSSTRIRQALAEGEIETAGELLGYPYHIEGRVVHGDKRGRELGFPTANIELHRQLSPLAGIFVAWIEGLEDQSLPSVVYIGKRPVFDGEEVVLEIHLLNFNRDIYGEYLRAVFLHKLRDDAEFSSKEELIEQIAKDKQAANTYFKNLKQ